MKKPFLLFGCLLVAIPLFSQTANESKLVIARLKYSGGGDWYNDPSCIPNLALYISSNTTVQIAGREAQIAIMDESLFSYPFLFVTGHGKIVLDDLEAERLRNYLLSGGFLYVDDDYGLDESFRTALKQMFPEKELVELPFSHEIYHCHYHFSSGVPKIHEHDDKAPQGFGLLDDQGRLMIFYTYETNISDGWASPDVHNDPPEKREQALKMGVNMVIYAMLH